MADKKPTYKNLGVPDEILDGIFEPQPEDKEENKNKEARMDCLKSEKTQDTEQDKTKPRIDKKTLNFWMKHNET